MPLFTSRRKRTLTYSSVIIFVVTIFLLGYIFYFIPNNRNTIHRNGFLILQNIAKNLNDGIESRSNLYSNIYGKSTGKKSQARKLLIDSLLHENNLTAEVKVVPYAANPVQDDSTETSFRIEKNKFIISIIKPSENEKVEFSEPIEQMLGLLSSQKSEVFSSYLLGKLQPPKSEVLYHDPDFAIHSDNELDSLLPRNEAEFLTGIRDLSSRDKTLKMFFHPFKIEGVPLVLCGLVESDKYNESVRRIPFYFVYPLAVLFLLLLVSLPIIKFYVMDANEQVGIKDVAFFGISILCGASLLTQIIIQFLLWKGEETRIEKNLVHIRDQIETQFTDEIVMAYSQLQRMDSLRKTQVHITNAIQQPWNYSDSVKHFLKASGKDQGHYYRFDRISWIDSSGQQQIKAELHAQPVFANVSARLYFQALQQGTGFIFPRDSTRRFGWEPIYSMTNGDFNITISAQSENYIVALAARMYSVLQTIMPAGYGFCIIDENGIVQLHSDPSRNLRENFFDKIEPVWEIKGAVESNQSRVVNDVTAYGKLHMMAVRPIGYGMPYSIVTFYDKGYIIPVNMRILIFTLLFFSLFFFICGILWLALARMGWYAHPLLYCPMDFLTWITPNQKEAPYYFYASMYTTGYIIFLFAYTVFNQFYTISNFNILAFLLVTPLNIILGLFCIRSAFIKPLVEGSWKEIKKKRGRVIFYITLHLLISLIVFLLSLNVYPINNWFLFSQLLINALLWLFALSGFNSRFMSAQVKKPFLFWYTFLATTLVVCIAVLPSGLFTWYAHNQEFIQSVKRQQLHLANSIRSRAFILQNMKGARDTDLLPDYYLSSLEFKKGIYTLNNDSISYGPCTTMGKTDVEAFEKFYFNVAEKLTYPYYNKQSFTALQDESSDESRHWVISDKSMHFSYRMSLPQRTTKWTNDRSNCLAIVSELPPRFIYLTGLKKFPLFLVILLLVFGLFKWLRKNAEQIFLLRYIYARGKKKEMTGSLVSEYFADKGAPDTDETVRLYSAAAYKHISACDKASLATYEEDMVNDIKDGKNVYDYVWSKCTEREKYILYDHAQDGLINYKNTREIIELMQKGVLVEEDERLRIFSPGFRAYILYEVDKESIHTLQKKFRQNSTWRSIQIPLLILLLGIAVLIFFTQQGIFDKLLVLIGGISTLLTLLMRFFGGSQTAGDKTS